MSKDLNRVMVIGRLGKDPETKYQASGKAMCRFSVASGRKWRDQDGNDQEGTEWFNIVTWDKLAETCAEYLHKGARVYIEGRLQTRSWDDLNTGQKRYMTEVIAQDMIMLDSKRDATMNGTQLSGGAAATDVDTDEAELPLDDVDVVEYLTQRQLAALKELAGTKRVDVQATFAQYGVSKASSLSKEQAGKILKVWNDAPEHNEVVAAAAPAKAAPAAPVASQSRAKAAKATPTDDDLPF